MATETKISTNGVEPVVTGPVMQARRQGRGPAIWLAGDPEDLKQWMDRGAGGHRHQHRRPQRHGQEVRPDQGRRPALPRHHR